jgi:HD-GYP domain-containing protein (c-di-GMP phosphodiesterase class II)
VLDADRRVELRLVRRSLYLNGTALESGMENFVYHAHVTETLRGAGIGMLELRGLPTRRDLQVFLSLVVRLSDPDDDPTRTVKLRRTLASQGVRTIDVAPPVAGGAGLSGEGGVREAARLAYEESVAASRELFTGTATGRSANVKQVKHAVQNLVDGVLGNESALGGLSALKDYDDYLFTHAVNVCILCIAMGRRLGLTKAQLYDLGHAALVHDIGMSRIPRDILTKGSGLTPEERARMEAHTWLGALRVFELRDSGEVPFRSMTVAYEHHMGWNGGGYPGGVRERKPSVFSRIISVAAAFDAATNERAYSSARPADEVLRDFSENERYGFDPVIVRALINLLGAYPAGTCVILESFELALVQAANPDPSFLDRPVVRILCDSDGRRLDPAPLVDLADTDENGGYLRSILKATSAERYGIRVADWLA